MEFDEFDEANTLEALEISDEWEQAEGDNHSRWREIEGSIKRLDSRRASPSRRASRSRREMHGAGFSPPSPVEPPKAARYAALLGLASFAPGVALLVWSFAAARTDLWSQGITLAIVGQGFLSIGVLLSIPFLWRRQDAANEPDRDDAY